MAQGAPAGSQCSYEAVSSVERRPLSVELLRIRRVHVVLIFRLCARRCWSFRTRRTAVASWHFLSLTLSLLGHIRSSTRPLSPRSFIFFGVVTFYFLSVSFLCFRIRFL